MEAARDKKDYARMERVCREGVQRGFHDEYLVRSLGWALCRQHKTAEGLQIARLNVEWNPGVFSYANLVEAALDDGQVTLAKQTARFLVANKNHWGPGANFAQDMVNRASDKVFRLTWKVPTTNLRAGEQFWLPKPMETRNQSLVSWKVIGVYDQVEKSDKYGNRFVVARAQGNEPIIVTTEVRLSPFSVKSLLGRQGTASSTSTEPFLAASPSRLKASTIDPKAAEVVAVTKSMGNPRGISAVIGMMNWINQNFTFCPPGSPPGADDPREVIKRRGGHCEAITSVEVSLLRASQVPARMIRGQSAVRTDTKRSTQHTILQYYLSGIGWVDWDYFIQPWQSRDDFVRLWVYNSVLEEGDVDHLADFFGRAFQELKGYRHELVKTTLD
ncbi:MAG: transglutaminase domain-containing protein [Fimbriimonadaceae bacterium]|nr:transglutaminase domain-containing protein [Fimbriimonadaceae bacterium]